MKHAIYRGILFLSFIIISSGIVIFGMIILNNNVTNIGIIELNGFLNEMNREISDVDYLGMVSKFQLHMDFYKDNINQQEFDKKELRVAMVITGYDNSVSIYTLKRNGFTDFLLLCINLMRTLIDKPPLSYNYANPTDTDLSLAYYYERNNYYDKALNVYDKALTKENLDKRKIPIIDIHRSFCLALLRKMAEAKTQLKDIINQYSDENIALTAATLLQYIIYFEQEINKTKASGESALNKSEKLYKLIAYDDAIEILNQMTLEDEAQRDKIQYLKARCYEEVGEKEKSLEIYQAIIKENSSSEIAGLANNRILIMGTMDMEMEKLKELAKANNDRINDAEFDEMLEVTNQYEEITKMTDEDLHSAREIEENTNAVSENEIEEFVNKSINDIQGNDTKATLEPAETPVPVQTPIPTTVPTEIPVPVHTLTPTTLPTETPVPVETATPSPVPAETPLPVNTAPPDLQKEKKTNEDGSYEIIYNSRDGISYKIEYYDESGSLQYYIEYLYDNEGRITGVVKKDKNGNIIE